MLAALAAGGLGLASPAKAPALTWAQAFNTPGVSALSFEYKYRDGRGAWHTVREAVNGARLRRDTDDRLTLYAQPGSDDTHYTLLDLKRRISVSVTRTNLYRIGLPEDAWSLRSLLAVPTGGARVQDGGKAATVAGQVCVWLTVTPQAAGSYRTCWSHKLALPLEVRDPHGATTLQVMSLNLKAPNAATFTVNDDGFARVNADEDVSE